VYKALWSSLSVFNDRVTQIFKNRYLRPRSPYCSLANEVVIGLMAATLAR
jgi:hypothetical protein